MKLPLYKLWWMLLFTIAVFTAINAVIFMTMSEYGDPGIQNRFAAFPIVGWGHIGGGIIAIVSGPFQFLGSLRQKHISLHRWMGRLYLMGVFISATCGFFFAVSTDTGWFVSCGFSLLAICWIWTGFNAMTAIKQKNFESHLKWMLRNYALTFAAASLRIELILLVLAGIPLDAAFKIVTWLCWILNWLIVELWMSKYGKELRVAFTV